MLKNLTLKSSNYGGGRGLATAGGADYTALGKLIIAGTVSFCVESARINAEKEIQQEYLSRQFEERKAVLGRIFAYIDHAIQSNNDKHLCLFLSLIKAY